MTTDNQAEIEADIAPAPAEDLQRYVPDIVKNAMLTAWNEICADTGFHPDDIEQNFEGRRRHLGFEPKHWARMTGENVARTLERGGYRPAQAAEVTVAEIQRLRAAFGNIVRTEVLTTVRSKVMRKKSSPTPPPMQGGCRIQDISRLLNAQRWRSGRVTSSKTTHCRKSARSRSCRSPR